MLNINIFIYICLVESENDSHSEMERVPFIYGQEKPNKFRQSCGLGFLN
jgi:hypothetical protein